MDVVAYARYSSDNQREESIQAQVRAITAYCEAKGFKIIKIYSDNAVTGTSTDDRTEFKKMLSDSDKKLFKKVIIHKLDRFARDRYDSAIARKKLKNNGIDLVSVLENLDGSPESIIMESVLEGMAEYYSANLSREVKKGFIENVSQGKYCGGVVPLGLRINQDNKYEIEPIGALIVKNIFEMRIMNNSIPQIQEWLKNKGYDIDKQVICNILKNEKYVGVLKHGQAININAIEPIIDIDTFQNAQKKRRSTTGTVGKNTYTKYLLTGITQCGLCGSPIAGGKTKINKNGNKYYYYRCNKKNNNSKSCSCNPVNKDFLEMVVIDFIKENILSGKMIKEISKEMKTKIEKKVDTEGISNIEKLIEKVDKKRKKLLEHLLEDVIDKNTYSEKILELDNEVELLNNKKKELLPVEESFELSKIEEYLLRLKKDFSSKDFNVKKSIINTFISKVTITNEIITIDYVVGSLDMAPRLHISKSTQIPKSQFSKYYNR